MFQGAIMRRTKRGERKGCKQGAVDGRVEDDKEDRLETRWFNRGGRAMWKGGDDWEEWELSVQK